MHKWGHLTAVAKLPLLAKAGRALGPIHWLHSVVLFCLCGMLVFSPGRTSDENAATVFFFSPETSINNFSMLKGEFDLFFASAGNHKFQPFNNRQGFEDMLHSKRSGLYLMSSWHYARLPDKANWKPVLIGGLNGKHTQRHVISAKKKYSSFADLKGRTIASAATIEFTQELLREMLPPDQQVLLPTFKILKVPKDVDALLSVGFGVATAALTTEGGLGKLSQINPGLFSKLGQIGTGPEKLLPVVVALLEPDAACTSLMEVLRAMSEKAEGQQRLRMLGLDGWQPIENVHLKLLGK